MRFRDRVFQAAFKRLPVYTILWEDADVDGQYLGVDESSSVLAISAAGCGVASLIAYRPQSIDAVDINAHHLALAALKARAAIDLRSYGEFYDLLGVGRHPRPERVLRRLTTSLPPWMRRYWYVRSGVFHRSLYSTGLTSRMLAAGRRIIGIDEAWFRRLARTSVEERLAEIERLIAPALERQSVRAALDSPFQLVTLGVNFEQRDRLLASHHAPRLAEFVLDHLRRVARTDLPRNWFAWHAAAGRFNHDDADAVPPFLRPNRHLQSTGAPTRLSFGNESILKRLASAGPDTWSHYMLCDAVDWMPHDAQRRLFHEIHRTAREGAIVLYRSVENISLVERHGLASRFQLLERESAKASLADRTRQYQRVNFYRVAK